MTGHGFSPLAPALPLLPTMFCNETSWDHSSMQDFFGVIEEMRVWGVVRSAEQIRAGMDADDGRGPGEEEEGCRPCTGVQ